MAYECKFKIGDVVFHKSNPKIFMVVYYVNTRDMQSDTNLSGVACRWINRLGDSNEKDFKPIELQKFDSQISL